MNMTNYELCHVSYRGNMKKEINAAREVLRKYGKSCADAVKELRHETDMPMTECGDMLRCLRRDAEIERIQVENAKLRRLVKEALMANKGGTFWEYFDPYSFWAGWCKDAHELGIEVDE